ncbi:hypothetical protein [Desulfohalovibrio reitneri]|uniref:hypothetical protein n=1 Tax=Desulfohalovibrio reitneri TaxID=1307759 RepID=UPI00110E018A|nr:hypothetical protein [Desulfohalovibrio reitneri]
MAKEECTTWNTRNSFRMSGCRNLSTLPRSVNPKDARKSDSAGWRRFANRMGGPGWVGAWRKGAERGKLAEGGTMRREGVNRLFSGEGLPGAPLGAEARILVVRKVFVIGLGIADRLNLFHFVLSQNVSTCFQKVSWFAHPVFIVDFYSWPGS